MKTPSNPYVGPRAFQPGESFYGRDRELRSLAGLLIAERIVLLHSPSGAGKTSLIQAGLLPILDKEEFTVLPIIRVNLDPPVGVTPLPNFNRYALSTMLSLEEGLSESQRLPVEELAGLTLDDYLEKRPRSENAFVSDVLIFDQFEEVLTCAPTDQEHKQVFFEQLGKALRNKDRWALVAIREDYLGALAPYTRPIPGRFAATIRLDQLSVDGALQAIQRPAKSKNVDFMDFAANLLVDDLRRIQVQKPDGSFMSEPGPNVEPVQLQVICYNLWEAGAAEDERIDENDLERVGSVDQMLGAFYANSIQKVCKANNIDERTTRRWFDRHLITSDEVRSQVLKGQDDTEGLPNSILSQLESAHLIRSETRAGKTWFELAHDRLVIPIRKENATWFDANLTLLQRQTELWHQQERPDGLLLRGNLLEKAEVEIEKLRLTSEEEAFLGASRKLHKQELRTRRLIGGVLALLGVALVALYFSAWAYNQSESRRVAALSQTALAEGYDILSIPLALQALRIADVQEGQDALDKSIQAINFVGDNLALIGHYDGVNTVTWSTDGRLASGSGDHTVILWNLEKGLPEKTLKGHEASVNSLAFSTGGQLASGSDDKKVILWDLAQGLPDLILEGHLEAVTRVAWSPDGRLASGSQDGVIIIWDLELGKPGRILKEHDGKIDSLAWSPANQLASLSFGKLILWDVDRGAPENVVDQILQSDIVWTENNQLVLAGPSGTMYWDPVEGRFYSDADQLSMRDDITNSAWSQDGSLAAGTRDGKVVFSESKGQELTIGGHIDWINSLAWSADGRLATASDDGTVVVWDLSTQNALQSYNPQMMDNETATDAVINVDILAWSLDGQRLAAGTYGQVSIWNLENRSIEKMITDKDNSPVHALVWSDDARLAFGSNRGRIFVWDPYPKSVVRTLQAGNENEVKSVVWLTGNRLVSGSEDGSVLLWNLDSGATAQTLWEHTGLVTSLAWSPGGYIASGSEDGTVIIGDATTFHQIWELTDLGYIEKINWSKAGLLAIGAEKVTVWDFGSGEPVEVHSIQGIPTRYLTWSPKDKLATSKWDGTIEVWDLEFDEPIATLKGNPGDLIALEWSPTGPLASVSLSYEMGQRNLQLNVWDERITRPLCENVFRNLTLVEWLELIGPWHIYRPACPNLPAFINGTPSVREIWEVVSNPHSMMEPNPITLYFAFTLVGRITVVVVALLLLSLITLVVRFVYQKIRGMNQKVITDF